MLFVLAFGIVPKRAMHNLVATHRDGQVKAGRKHDATPALDRATFNCPCDNLIIESPFMPGLPVVVSPVSPAVAPMNGYEAVASVHVEAVSFGLRGPPVA